MPLVHHVRPIIFCLLCAPILVATGCHRPAHREPTDRLPPPMAEGGVSLVGSWSLEQHPAPAGSGIRLELHVDSVADGSVHGALLTYFAGNVGAGTSNFPHFAGTVTPAGAVAIEIGHADVDGAGFRFAGVITGDTIPLSLFVVGPDTMSGGGVVWRLVRTHAER